MLTSDSICVIPKENAAVNIFFGADMKIGINKAAEIAEMTPQNLRYLIERGIGPECEKDHNENRVFEDDIVRSWYKQYKKTRSEAR